MGAQDHSKAQEKKSRLDWWKSSWGTLLSWLQEVEMGVVWGVAGVSLISFIFTSIWYIDPALLTMVLQFQPATCTTVHSSYLVGITNCTWTSCRHGCTSEIFKCWHVVVNVSLVAGSRPIPPPWASISSLALPPPPPNISKPAKLYPNVKGCGYPPKLQCEDFFDDYGTVDTSYPCWVSHLDPEMALTELNLKSLKEDVMYSLLPLGTFILSTLYALCRLGVFSICNPLRCCPRPPDSSDQTRLTPKQLFRYKKALLAKKAEEMKQGSNPSELQIPPTIPEGGEAAPDVHDSEDDITQREEEEKLRHEQEQEQEQENPFVDVLAEIDNQSSDQLIIDNFPDEIQLDLDNLSSVLDQLDNLPYQQINHKKRHKRNQVADINSDSDF